MTIDDGLHGVGEGLPCLYRSGGGPLDAVEVEPRNGKAVRVELQPAAFVAIG